MTKKMRESKKMLKIDMTGGRGKYRVQYKYHVFNHQ